MNSSKTSLACRVACRDIGSVHDKNFTRYCVIVLMALTCLRIEIRAQAVVGAITPFFSVEAETGTLGGGATIVTLTSPPTTPYSSPQLEASGHAYVQLTGTGQYV